MKALATFIYLLGAVGFLYMALVYQSEGSSWAWFFFAMSLAWAWASGVTSAGKGIGGDQ